MGGLEEKSKKVDFLKSKGKYKDAISIIIELLKQNENKEKIYHKFIEILNLIPKNVNSSYDKFEIYIKCFNYLKSEDKDNIRTEIVKIFEKLKSSTIIDYKKQLEELEDFELDFQIQRLLDNKIIQENPIDYSNKFENFEKIIEQLKNLYKQIKIKSLKHSIKYKMVDCYIDKGKKITENLITLTDINVIKDQLNILNQIKISLKEINSHKESLEFVDSLINTGKSYLLMIEGKKLISEEKFVLAYEKFTSIDTNRELFQIENLEIICIRSICQSLEDDGKYDKALELYKKNKYFKTEEIRVEILKYFNEANNSFKKEKYDEAIKMFVKMYKTKEKLSNSQIIENIFTICANPFLNALSSYCKQIWDEKDELKFLGYENKIKDIYKDINDEMVKKNFSEILNFISDMKKLGKEGLLKEKIMNEKNINSYLPEILQRIYMEILLSILYSKNDTKEIIQLLNIIIKYAEEDLYISREDLIKLRTLFSLENNKENKKLLVSISKLYYIFSKKGIEFEKDILIIIGNKIISIIKEKNNKSFSYTEEEFNQIMINLFLSLEKLIKEKDYKLDNVEKIYNLTFKSQMKNPKLIDILLNGYYYLYQKDVIFSNETINNLLKVLLEGEKNEKLLDVILSVFKKNKELYQGSITGFFKLVFKYPQKEENILNIISLINMKDNILNNQDFHKVIDLYLNKNDYYNSIFLIIEKISISNRTSKMMEKYSLFEEKKKKEEKSTIHSMTELNPEFNKRNLRLREYYNYIECGIGLDIEQLKDIEDNLNLNGFYDLLITLLEKQNNLVEKLNLSLISQYFSIKNYKLFKIISDKKIIWKEKCLLIIMKGFGKNNEEEKRKIIEFLELIKSYQTMPKIIEKNLEFEKNFKNYEAVENIETVKLIKLLDDFKEIKYFSNKYFKTMNKLITYSINNPNTKKEDNNIIFKKIIELLKSTGFNVSQDILEICIQNISKNEFIENYSEIISNKKVKFFLKKVIFDKISGILKRDDIGIKLEIIKKMKYFIDWEKIPSDLLNILNDNLDINIDGNYSELSKEIIYLFGIICSELEENKIKKEFFEKIRKEKLFDLIYKQLPKLKENYIIYILSLIIYYGKKTIDKNNYYSFPRQILIEIIKEKLADKAKNEIFEESLNYFESFHKFDIFNPKRDIYIRKLIFNKKININNISQILMSKCTENERIESIEGEIINGKIFGFGKMHYTNGDYYIGYFLNNIKEGEGEFFENGNSIGIKQVWKEGKLCLN